MQITIVDDSGPTAKVVLNGKLDIAGANTVALPPATRSGGKSGLVLDMAGVSFIASIGIRHRVAASKALARRGLVFAGRGSREGEGGRLRRLRHKAGRASAPAREDQSAARAKGGRRVKTL